DPAPGAAGRGELRSGSWLHKLQQMIDTVELAWHKHMVEYNLDQQVQLARGARRLTAGLSLPRWVGAARTRMVRVLLGAAAGTIILVCAGRVLRRRRVGNEQQRAGVASAAAGPAVALYRKVLRRCARHGAVREVTVTPLAFARTLVDRQFPGADVVSEATWLYYASRFGGRPAAAGELAALAAKLDRIGRSP